MNLAELGGRIRARREARGLKQADIANALQISAQAVSKWERGENAPDISLLAPLTRLLGVSVEWLLGEYQEQRDVFPATVLVSSVLGYARKSTELPLDELALWSNGLLFTLTETVLAHDGVPVKYLGDGLLAFFSGPRHGERAIAAAHQSARLSSDPLKIALAAGDIYLGTLGHPDYTQLDIVGEAVNVAFGILAWLGSQQHSGIAATTETLTDIEKVSLGGKKKATLSMIGREVEVCEVEP